MAAAPARGRQCYNPAEEAALTDEPGPPRADGPDLLLGRLVAGKYQVQALIAQGGMGRIYRAEQVGLGRKVALKVLNPRYHEVDPQFEKRFMQEAETCGQLRSPNTVTIYDHGRIEEEGISTLFMVMEYIEGLTLRQVLAREGRLTEDRAVAIAIGIARSLREAHKHGIVHRDLKPSNLILVQGDDGESVKVVDFGVAKVLRSDLESLTMADRIIGSPRYMAPEQIRHQTVDGRADVYAVGVLLFEMLAGQSPYRGEHAVDTLMMHLTADFPTIHSQSGRTVDPELEGIIRKCTEKTADSRFKTVGDLLRALTRWQQRRLGVVLPDEPPSDFREGDTGSIEPPPDVRPSAPSGRITAVLVALTTLTLGLVLFDLGTWMLRTPPAPSPPVAQAPMPLAPTPEPVAPEPVVEAVAPTPAAPAAAAPTRPVPPVAETTGALTIRTNRRAIVYLNGSALGYAPVEWRGATGSYLVAAMLPGQPDTRQTREVALAAEPVTLDFEFELVPVVSPEPPTPAAAPEEEPKGKGRKSR
jgi:serine/threonine-protein kinase